MLLLEATEEAMQIKQTERIVGKSERTVFIDPNPKRVREMLDKNGNVIDPKTKVIIKKAEDNK